MDRVNLYGLYYLGMNLHPLGQIKAEDGKTVGSIFLQSFSALEALEKFVGSEFIPVGISKDAAKRLIALIERKVLLFGSSTATAEAFREHAAKPLTPGLVAEFVGAVGELETLMANELPRLDIYSVSQLGIYSTPALIEKAETALSEDVRAAISAEAKRDLNQSGRCLAFGLSTAAGYHAMRATEKVQREYYVRLVKKPERVNMKQCTDELKKAGAPPEIMGILDQIRELHRNPVDHPEIFLEMAEAQELFDVAKSAISAMGRQVARLNDQAAKALPAASAASTPGVGP